MGKLSCHKLYCTTVKVDFHCHLIFYVPTHFSLHAQNKTEAMHWCREVQHLRLRAAFYMMPLFYLRTYIYATVEIHPH